MNISPIITLYSAAQLYARIQQWIDGDRSTYTLRQLNEMAEKISALLIWADDIISEEQAEMQRKMLDKLDIQRDVILSIVGQEVAS